MTTWVRSQFNLTTRTLDGWNDLTDRMRQSDEAMRRLRARHPELRAGSDDLVWAAYLQWVRIRGRAVPELCQPSFAVDELWCVLAQNRSLRRALPDQVRAMRRLPVRGHHARGGLDDTRVQAQFDQGVARLPFLFEVDELTRIDGGRLYQPECTRSDCRRVPAEGHDPEPGRTCLHAVPWLRSPTVS